MLRRSHKKSRGGCLQCKRRHVKCDEQRPICNLCAVSERTCSFASQSDLSDTYRPSEAASSSSGLSTAGLTWPTLHIHHQGQIGSHPSEENAINLDHMELMMHAVMDRDLVSLGGDRDLHAWLVPLDQTAQASLDFPYLLHEVLAFSARHLAVLRPLKRSFYMHQAITLQTRAVSLFNSSSDVSISKETCVPVLLFSTILGHHVLTDTLSRRDEKDLDSFLTYFVPCLDTLKGVYIIFDEARELWKGTILGPLLSLSSSFTSRIPTGTTCQRVKNLVEESSNLKESEKEACRRAIRYVQLGFEAVLGEYEDANNRYQMLYLWCICIPREFIVLLAAKNTEALIILGYYATLLGYGKHIWQVGDAGDYMIRLIKGHLGEKVSWDWSL